MSLKESTESRKKEMVVDKTLKQNCFSDRSNFFLITPNNFKKVKACNQRHVSRDCF